MYNNYAVLAVVKPVKLCCSLILYCLHTPMVLLNAYSCTLVEVKAPSVLGDALCHHVCLSHMESVSPLDVGSSATLLTNLNIGVIIAISLGLPMILLTLLLLCKYQRQVKCKGSFYSSICFDLSKQNTVYKCLLNIYCECLYEYLFTQATVYFCVYIQYLMVL